VDFGGTAGSVTVGGACLWLVQWLAKLHECGSGHSAGQKFCGQAGRCETGPAEVPNRPGLGSGLRRRDSLSCSQPVIISLTTTKKEIAIDSGQYLALNCNRLQRPALLPIASSLHGLLALT